jgi:hypothetical protein
VKVQVIRPEYVEQLPEQLQEGVLYICEGFDVTAHKCCCGCGEDVYNKLGPARWRLVKMSAGSVSLHPSVGNWKYACQSHYWIRNNRVINAGPMSARAIKAVQKRDRRDRDRYIGYVNTGDKKRMNLWESTLRVIGRTVRHLRSLWPW